MESKYILQGSGYSQRSAGEDGGGGCSSGSHRKCRVSSQVPECFEKKKKFKTPGHVDRSDDSTAVRILTVGFLLPLRFHVSHREKWEELRVDDVALYHHKKGGGGRGRGVWKKYDVSL